MPVMVIPALSILFFPTRACMIPTGTERIKNQMKAAKGIRPSMKSLFSRSPATRSLPIPTRSTKLITKKERSTGATSLISIFFSFI